MEQPHNPFSLSNLPSASIDVITVKARRVQLTMFTKQTELELSRAFGSSDDKEITRVASNIMRQHVLVNGKQISDWDTKISLVEETDLIWLLWVHVYGSRLFFRPQCVSCGTVNPETYEVNPRLFKRYIEECGDEQCPCHEVNRFVDENPGLDSWEHMQEMWDEVPEDHLTANPPLHCYKPGDDASLKEDIRQMHDGLVFQFRDLMPKDRNLLATLMSKRDENSMAKLLRVYMRRISWPQHNLDTGDILTTKKARHEIARTLDKIESMALREAVRDAAETVKRGVDASMIYRCTSMKCQTTDTVRVPISQDFLSHRQKG